MNESSLPLSPRRIDTAEIEAARGSKNQVDPDKPYAFLVEPERTDRGDVVDVATIFLTNRECPFRCLMCDLWKNTTDEPVSRGSIPRQIDYALERLPAAEVVKLYNSGNFFDAKAIPPSDLPEIARQVASFDRVIIENHPRLCSDACKRFHDQLAGEFEIAMGLETVHPEVLPALNKQMTLDDFARATKFLLASGIHVRSFVLLKPPFLDEDAGIEWAIRSLEFAFSHGVGCCSVIATRAGNGILDQLQPQGKFSPPRLSSLEIVAERGLELARGRVFVDLWEADQLAACSHCRTDRLARLQRMNLTQRVEAPVVCGANCEEQAAGR